MNKITSMYVRCSTEEEQLHMVEVCKECNAKLVSEGGVGIPSPIKSNSAGYYFVYLKDPTCVSSSSVTVSFEKGCGIIEHIKEFGLKED